MLEGWTPDCPLAASWLSNALGVSHSFGRHLGDDGDDGGDDGGRDDGDDGGGDDGRHGLFKSVNQVAFSKKLYEQVIVAANRVYHDFLASEDGSGFSGQVAHPLIIFKNILSLFRESLKKDFLSHNPNYHCFPDSV